MICPICETENRDSAEFCSLCGNVFIDSTDTDIHSMPLEEILQTAIAEEHIGKEANQQPPSTKEGAAFTAAVGREPAPIATDAAALPPAVRQAEPVSFTPTAAPTEPSQYAQTQQPGASFVPAAPPPYMPAYQPAVSPTYRQQGQAVSSFSAVQGVCTNCGKPMLQNESFCTRCGKPAAFGAAPIQKKRKTPVLILLSAIAVLGVVAVILATMLPSVRYNKALDMMDSGNYEEAYTIFNRLGDYQNAKDNAEICTKYVLLEQANALLDSGEYQRAQEIFFELDDFENAPQGMLYCQAMLNYDQQQYWLAYSGFEQAGDYRDAAQRMEQCVQEMPETGVLEHGYAWQEGSRRVEFINQCSHNIALRMYTDNGEYVCMIFVRVGESVSFTCVEEIYSFNIAVDYESKWFGTLDFFGDLGVYGHLELDGALTVNLIDYVSLSVTFPPGLFDDRPRSMDRSYF